MPENDSTEVLSNPEANWQVAYGRAMEMASFKGGFLMRTAHELRSPLNKIISLQQMIIEGLCDDIEEERQFVADAYAASMKMLEYLDLMIRVSKIEVGRLQPQMQPASLAEVLTQVQDLTQVQIADRNLRFQVDLPVVDVMIETDPAWLRNLLTLLIEMAVEGGDRGTLSLAVALADDGTFVICLADDRATTPWQEPVELPPRSEEFTLNDTLSVSLRMSLVHAMIAGMQGQLSLALGADEVTRLQITLPLIASQ
jgi:signal transduction histidine kinase